MPAVGDTGWAVPINGNASAIDALAPVGGLCVTPKEVPSASLNVAVAAGSYVQQDGTVATYAGATSQAIPTGTTRVLYLDLNASGALTVAAAYPATPHVRLATVVAGATTITSITDNRLGQHCGQRIPSLTHLLSTGSAPTIAAGTAAGTSPTVSLAGTDIAGVATITTGTTPGTGTLATITFNLAFGTAPRAILLTPANANAAGVTAKVYANSANVTTAHFTIDAASALTAATSYLFSYLVIG